MYEQLHFSREERPRVEPPSGPLLITVASTQ